MSKDVQLLFLIALAVFIMQSIGGWFQIQDYKKAVNRMHRLGNVGIGQKKGGFFSGYLVLVSCNTEGMVTGAEIMDGITFLAKFRPCKTVLGKELYGIHINDLLNIFYELEQRKRKHFKGYIQALEALKMRLEEKQPI